MNPFSLIQGTDFDAVTPEIRCKADREGARVFEIIGSGDITLRVLAHTEAAAKAHADSMTNEEINELLDLF